MILRDYPAQARLTAYAEGNGWPLLATFEEDPEQGTVHELIWAVDPAVSLHYAEDRLTQSAYVLASGASRADVDRLGRRLGEELETIPLQELLRDCDESREPREIGRAVTRLTLGAPRDFDAAVFRRVERVLAHEDPDVRRMGVWAVSFMPWPEYRPLLAEMADGDADPEVRDTAADLVAAYRVGREGDGS
jgi:hypothetical protein